MARFVILRHEMPPDVQWPSHWDFMVEHEGALRTWALAEEPTIGHVIAATPLAEHRLAYLDYEGPVSGGRGSVTRWDRGECTIELEAAERIVVDVQGQRLVGRLEMELRASIA